MFRAEQSDREVCEIAMNRIANPLLMLVPPELMGVLIMSLWVAGGFAFIVGARRTGGALVTVAIAIPLITVIVEALIGEAFALLPDALVMPVAFLITLALWLTVGWMLVKLVFGQRAVDEAKGHLLADALKAILRTLFRHPAILIASVFLLYLAWVPS